MDLKPNVEPVAGVLSTTSRSGSRDGVLGAFLDAGDLDTTPLRPPRLHRDHLDHLDSTSTTATPPRASENPPRKRKGGERERIPMMVIGAEEINKKKNYYFIK